jgi:hypothetical protein
VDFDCIRDVDRRRSMRKYVLLFFGGAVSWMNKWQDVVTLSTADADYMATTHACKEAISLMTPCSKVGLS